MRDSDLPKISILTPTYNRSKFLPLYFHNLKRLNYPHDKLEVCIDDEGKEPFINYDEFKEQIKPMTLVYHRDKKRRTIGEKRNHLVKKLSSNKIMCFMDDDDIYDSQYVIYSYMCLLENKCGLVGSSSMLFTYPELGFKLTGIRCPKVFQIHEATMLFTRKYFNSMGGFDKSSQGEGYSFILNQEKNVFNTDINNVMICVGHDGNSVDKMQFSVDENKLDIFKGPEVNILKEIFNIE